MKFWGGEGAGRERRLCNMSQILGRGVGGKREEIMQHVPKNSVTTSANQTYEMWSLHGSGAHVIYIYI